jgi:hypothetical protein
MPSKVRSQIRSVLAPSESYTPKGVKVGGKMKVKKSKKPANVGPDKGQLHLVNGAFKVRRFTADQRQAFRAKRGKVFGGPSDGRPTR